MTIPGVTSTGSKRPESLFGPGDLSGLPTTMMMRSAGSRLWDAEGREYLDYVMALGAVTFGYGHPPLRSSRRTRPTEEANQARAHLAAGAKDDKITGEIPERFHYGGGDVGLSYGLRIFGEKMSVSLGLLNTTDGGVFPGVPYVDFVIRF
ncbi:MAG: aminotransferase class III-fold pyridoxal phosphate-dependent enzyme [Gemmatimonadetes bacterium]|nr:aminotransferase class III-fold pyridoxal phosphate-dependent enzyme [Gemmatimonadota bacterium]